MDDPVPLNSEHPSLAVDLSAHFSTNKIFNSREELIEWCRSVGRKANVAVVTLKSDKSKLGGWPRIILGCERSGIYRPTKQAEANIDPNNSKETRTRKCNCPFKLKGVHLFQDTWKLKVLCGSHNHPVTENLTGHSFISRLTAHETQIVEDMSKSGVSPKDVFLELKKYSSNNKSTIKTIYNARQRLRVLEMAGRQARPQMKICYKEKIDAKTTKQDPSRFEYAQTHEESQDQKSVPQPHVKKDQQIEGLPQYKHIETNDFSYRKHKKQKEEDIAICDCRYNGSDPDSACGERCLNALTSTECTPGYCPCGNFCKNQKFQRCEYAKSRLFKTEGRGWGVLADEDIKGGQFVIEYCGEVISCQDATKRSHAYENQGLKDAYIITLNGNESIDATKKGSFARFINHSCQPNCETRKWNVLGEVRVGIFAKQDIPAGTELAYDYNFEWYGGAKVRCLCGAPCCSGFLGAKSRGFQEDTYLWEDNDDRYSVENVPLYDSEEDEPTSKLTKADSSTNIEYTSNGNDIVPFGNVLEPEECPESSDLVTEKISSVPVEGIEMEEVKTEVSEENKVVQHENHTTFAQMNPMISRIRSNSACRNYHIQTSPVPNKRSKHNNRRSKILAQKEVDAKRVCQLLASMEAREEVYNSEERKKHANSQLNSLFEEIRPAIEEHERDSQDSVSTSVAQRWIGSHCSNLKAEFNFGFSVIKNLACTPRRAHGEESSTEATVNDMPAAL